MIIAIDGPAGVGKGTLAKKLATHYSMSYLDTGTLYRAVGLSVLMAGQNPADTTAAASAAQGLDFNFKPVDGSFRAFIADQDVTTKLRTQDVGQAASVVSAIPAVRAALKDFQVHFAATHSTARGVILDGRDIGTVICPHAEVKFFLDARPEIRAQRRVKELREAGREAVYETVLAEIIDRDDRDRNRSDAPLKAADDAILLDTSDLGIDDVFAKACAVVEKQRARANKSAS
ncbi:MAG: (d)CMP kinase [Proteobacteria bacterium]|nr:(d)CMP kinase [Pseudomonadota bacterium]